MPETVRNRAITSSENIETNKVDRNAPITSKHVFPKRSAKMIDGTERPKIPSKFAKSAARYNEFGYIYFYKESFIHLSWTVFICLFSILRNSYLESDVNCLPEGDSKHVRLL